MNRKIFILSLIGVLLYLGALFLVGSSLASLYSHPDAFSVNDVQRISGENGKADEWVISGSGFDKNTRVVLSADIGNNRALIDSVPLWGSANDMNLIGDELFVANIQLGIQVVDIRDPLHPVVKKTLPTPNNPVEIYKNENRLFVTCGGEGVWIYDYDGSQRWSHHRSTVRVNSTIMMSRVSGNLLYTANGNDGVIIIDISQSSEIDINRKYQVVAGIEIPGKTLSLEVKNSVLFVATDASGLYAYNVEDPMHPELITNIPLDEHIQAFHVEDRIIYIATRSGRILTFDTSNLSMPSLLGSYFFGGKVSDFELIESRLYVADGIYGLVAFDVSNPKKIELTGIADVPGQARAVTIYNNIAYVLSASEGLQIIDLTKITVPSILSSITTSGKTGDVLFDENWLYLTNPEGFHVFERGNLTQVQQVNSHGTDNSYSGMVKYGQYVYVVKGRDGVVVIDVSTPGQARIVGSIDLPGWPKRITLSKDRLIVPAMKGGFHVVDLSVPYRPQLIETVSDIGVVGHIATDGRFLYVSSTFEGVLVYELTEEGRPVFVSKVVKPWPLNAFTLSMDIELRNNTLYVANGDDGLQIIDVSNPYEPVVVSTLALPGLGMGIYIDGDWAFVTCPKKGIYAVDISDPENPRNLGCVVYANRVKWMDKIDGRLWVVTGNADLKEVPWPQELLNISHDSSERIRVEIPALNKDMWFNLNISSRNDHKTVHGVSSLQM